VEGTLDIADSGIEDTVA